MAKLTDYNNNLQNDFPILGKKIHGTPLIYLDNAATTQKPQCVIDALVRFYSEENSNVHRGLHYLSQVATEHYEAARKRVTSFLGADDTYSTIFTSGVTEAINLAAHGLGTLLLKPKDEILITQMEHHSNIIPWQLLCEKTGAQLRIIPISDAGELLMEEFERLLNARTKIVAVTHVSNVLGTVNPIREICSKAKEQGAISLIDGAQSAAHLNINIQDIGADFFVCSAHKMYGPTGIGVLCGPAELLNRMSPYQSGSGMVESVTFEKTSFRTVPDKFEAGTPHIAGAIGLTAALDYLSDTGMDAIESHEQQLLAYGTKVLTSVEGLRIIGNAKKKTGVLSFTLENVHPHDIAQLLDNDGIAIRSGHHCAQPLMQFYHVPATARASLGIYNSKQDIDSLVNALHTVREVFP
ncbi:MAG: cysteine desulfurase [Candidatus Hydrogenedentes bacterium]|nr:cysteine desulfurase [Candidatus Hydrogenedentota bacterium]